jgi:putative FmdB family regulatory protein
MAKFKCKNCGRVFEQFCDDADAAKNTKCPSCESRWTEIIGNDSGFVFPILPYSDPIWPVPNIIVGKYWYKETINKIHNDFHGWN